MKMSGRSVLILGGARSGKSALAQEMAQQFGKKVLFVATAEPLDDEMRSRIEIHKINRPQGWRTLEATVGIGEEIIAQIADAELVVIDCVTVLVSNVMFSGEGTDTLEAGQPDYASAEKKVIAEIEGIIKCLDSTQASFIIVSNEVGMGLVPVHESDTAGRAGRIYRDLLGKANQLLAQRADDVYLLIAGIPWQLKGRA
ncbi:MAG: bifunctional adenosylcobinamide kinase/adenosylcobinamide-phosphate guanylyltransferase [Chloroflexi bacterium]|nr:bifunctional adenosylcobinamide kinase/adenosylcobinamide-phosphate guanylyltransferase [Chloroflexota bacterium]